MTSIKEKLLGIIFQQEGKKRTVNKSSLRKTSIGLSALGLLAIIMGEPESISRRKAEFQLVGVPTSSQSISVPDHQSADDKSKSKVEKTTRERRLPGPSLISRPGVNDILPGTVIKARLQTVATDGPVKAVLTEDITVDGDLKIPSGSILIGFGQSVDSRVAIQFSKAIMGERDVIEINAIALDSEDQLVGLQASKMSGEAIKLGASVGLNFVGGMAEGLKDRVGINGTSVDQSSMRNALLNGASKASLEEAKSLMEETKSKKYSLSVDSGTPILIFFNGAK
jgi:hypothetical protein